MEIKVLSVTFYKGSTKNALVLLMAPVPLGVTNL